MTILDLIKSSLRLLGVYNFGETLTADEASDAMEAFNMLVGSWSAEGLLIPAYTSETFSLIVGQASYTIGSGGNFNTTRPVRIAGTYVTSGNIDYPIDLVGPATYRNNTLKSTEGIPYQLHFKTSYPLGYLYFYPTPDSTYTFHIDSEKYLSEMSTLPTSIVLPPEYLEALKLNLAQAIGPEYQRQLSPLEIQRAYQLKRMIKNNNMVSKFDSVNINTPMGITGNISNGNIFGDN